MPPVNALYREFKGQGLEVLLIDFRESPAIFAQSRLFRIAGKFAFEIPEIPVQLVDTANMPPAVNRTGEADNGNQRQYHRKNKENDTAKQ